jgi:hypothetical protein
MAKNTTWGEIEQLLLVIVQVIYLSARFFIFGAAMQPLIFLVVKVNNPLPLGK